MAKVRYVRIRNFRSIQSLDWAPAPGINCLLGAGDSGKSTVLEAIEACLSVRRNLSFADTDFHKLDLDNPIVIRVTLGDLKDDLKDLDAYGDYLRAFDRTTNKLSDEPQKGQEVVLTVELRVTPDLEPVWRLYSARTAKLEALRNLPWAERQRISPARLGSHSSSNLSWTKGSVLHRLSEEKADVSAALVAAARDAREGFGAQAATSLKDALATVAKTAIELGVPIGKQAQALLDAHAVSFADGTVALHDEWGVPLRSLGTGSARLLLAGLHQAVADDAAILLVDEVEHGLEPHRLIRLLHSLGSKADADSAAQVFMTSHSPVVVRELAGDQIFVMRSDDDTHIVSEVGTGDSLQGTARMYPDAFLARRIVVCEGATEVGLLRGIDLFHAAQGRASLYASATAFVDSGGGTPERALQRALAFRQLGYQSEVLIDGDCPLDQAQLKTFEAAGGKVWMWKDQLALEDVIFQELPTAAIAELLAKAIDLNSPEWVQESLQEVSKNSVSLDDIEGLLERSGRYSDEHRVLLGKAAKFSRKAKAGRAERKGWFKSVGKIGSCQASCRMKVSNQAACLAASGSLA